MFRALLYPHFTFSLLVAVLLGRFEASVATHMFAKQNAVSLNIVDELVLVAGSKRLFVFYECFPASEQE